MSKGPYSARPINRLDLPQLCERFEDQRLIVGIDVAKELHYVCLMGTDPGSYIITTVDNRHQIPALIDLLGALPVGEIQVVMEPSGSYGDPLRHQLKQQGFEVYLMASDACTQAQKLFDGVPSLHDGKSAWLLARLRGIDIGKHWRELSDERRQMKSLVRQLEQAKDTMQQHVGWLEAALARHWPELCGIMKLKSVTLLTLLGEMGGPQQVARDPRAARELMRRASRGTLGSEKIEATVAMAKATQGLPPVKAELQELAATASSMLVLRRRIDALERQLVRCVDAAPQAREMSKLAGKPTAAVVVALLGDPNDFASARGYEKSAGLNVKIRSSGKYEGQLKITKRGPSKVRKYLYMLAMRIVQGDRSFGCPWLAAWYQQRLERNGGCAAKALVAVMRKLIVALYHVGRGAPYQPEKLVDISRLSLRPG